MSVNLLELDLNSLELVKHGKTIKLMRMDNNNLVPLKITTGIMYIPFGVKTYNNSYSSFNSCHIDCSLNQSKSEISVRYREVMQKLDERILELIKKNLDLFDKIVCSDDDEINYSPLLRDNQNYPELIKISLPRDRNGNFVFFLFNEKKEKIPVDDSNIDEVLSKGKTFKSVLDCGKIWYYNDRFGSVWNLEQLRFTTSIQESTSSQRQQMTIKECIIDED